MTAERNSGGLDYSISSDLHRIYALKEYAVDFYMNNTGSVYWSISGQEPKLLKFLPRKYQAPFLMKFIRDHSMSEKLKFIEDPIVSIEIYIKADFLRRT